VRAPLELCPLAGIVRMDWIVHAMRETNRSLIPRGVMNEAEADEIDLRCPQVVADNAAKGLRLRQQFGRGGTEIGVARATELKNRDKLAPSVIRRMVSYFARHEVDKRGKNYGNEANPSAGYIAWLLWGGDEGRAWALDLKKKIGNAPDI